MPVFIMNVNEFLTLKKNCLYNEHQFAALAVNIAIVTKRRVRA